MALILRRRRTAAPVHAAEPLECRRLLAATLLRDVNQTPVGAAPADFVEYGGAVYFAASGLEGRELYRSGGVGTAATLVKDARPGPDGSGPRRLAVAGDTLYFTADTTPAVGRELWKSDGTAEGTVLVTDLFTADGSSEPDLLTDFNGTLFFTASDPQHGRALWKTDGTSAGTVLVNDPVPGPAGNVTDIQIIGDTLYFAAENTADVPARLWKTDGTEAGTVPVKDFGLFTSGGPRTPFMLTPLGDGRLVFTYGRQLWVTDGTSAGTAQLREFGGGPYELISAGGTVYFEADAGLTGDQATGSELWVTDGTTAGTRLVKDLRPGRVGSNLGLRATLDGRLLFTADDGTNRGLWRSDGTAAGTTFVAPVDARMAVVSGGVVYLVEYASNGHALWRTDGTEAGTVRLRTFRNLPIVGVRPAAFGGGVIFEADDGATGLEPWFSDGTADGTVLLADVNERTLGSGHASGVSMPIAGPMSLGGRVVFGANDGGTQHALWSTDGTTAGTTRLSTFTGGPIAAIVPGANSTAYVFSSELDREPQLWRTDGTSAGTTRIRRLRLFRGQTLSTAGRSLVMSDGTTYLSAEDPREGWGVELWKTDGTTAGTVTVKQIGFGGGSSWPGDLTDVDGTLYFTALMGAELWKSDGTEAGTVMLRRFPGGNSIAGTLLNHDGTLFFRATGTDRRVALWKSDGTAEGTALVKQFENTGIAPAGFPHDIVSFGGFVYFTASMGAATPVALWRSDGTAEGTVPLTDVLPAAEASNPASFTVAHGRLYFVADDAQQRYRLWSTDGTAAGTIRLTGDAGPAVAGRVILGVVNGRVYFTGLDPSLGAELWSTDGTPAGTAPVHDVNPGPPSSWAGVPAAAGEHVVFWADDGVHGVEPWVEVAGVPRASVAARHVFYNGSALDGFDNAADARDDAAIAADKLPLLPGQPAAFHNVTSYSRGITGIMIDIANLRAGRTLTADDFSLRAGSTADPTTWTAVAEPTVAVRRGAGARGSDRVTLTWRDGAIRNAWLRVTVAANDRTGLAAQDVFYFGNLVGDTGGRGTPRVDAMDVARTRAAIGRIDAVSLNRFDFNRDGAINAADVLVVRNNQRNTLPLFTAPAATGPAATSAAGYIAVPPTARPFHRPSRRGMLDATEPRQLE